MKKSLSHLPKRKQDELRLIVEKIRTFISPEMIILFGSYARGDWKDGPCQQGKGRMTIHKKSDYDILVVTSEPSIASDSGLWHKVNDECKEMDLSTHFRIITHDIDFFNKRLEEGHYFFSDIRDEGIVLYDSDNHKLADKKELKPSERKKLLREYFEHWFGSSKEFYDNYEINLNKQRYKNAAFQLHQSAEAAYKAVLLVITEYCPSEHFLGLLGEMAVRYDVSLDDIFPTNTEEQRQLFDLLDYAYIGARYDPKYKITKGQLEYLAERVKVLQKLAKKICGEKIKSLV